MGNAMQLMLIKSKTVHCSAFQDERSEAYVKKKMINQQK